MTTYSDKETGIQKTSFVDLVNAYIRRFAEAVNTATGKELDFPSLDDDGFSKVSRGSATVGITALPDDDMLIFIARIMSVPSQRETECYRLLLELNYSATSEGAFAIDKNTHSICLRAHRSISGLDYEEFEMMLNSVATVADEWDDRLTALFPESV